MSNQVFINETVLKAGVEAALKEMGAGLADGMKIGAIIGIRPDGSQVRLKGAQATVVAPPPPSGLRLAAVDGNRL